MALVDECSVAHTQAPWGAAIGRAGELLFVTPDDMELAACESQHLSNEQAELAIAELASAGAWIILRSA